MPGAQVSTAIGIASICQSVCADYYTLSHSFAYVEISLIMAKLHYRFDLELVNKSLDWEGSSRMHVMWWKPDLWVRFMQKAGV